MTQTGPNWDRIKKCQLWPILGVTECDNCEHVIQCWGTNTQLPEPTPKVMERLRELLQGGIS